MFRFFSTQDKVKATVQAYNLIVLGMAAYDFVQNPETTGIKAVEIAIHALTVLSLKPNADLLTSWAVVGLNFFAMGSHSTALSLGCDNGSDAMHQAHLAAHLVNAGVLLLGTESRPEPRIA